MGGGRWRRAGPCGSRRHLGLIWNCSIAASRLSRMFQHSSLSGVRSHRSIRAREWAAGRCASRPDLDWRKSESRIWRPLPWRLLGNGRGAGIRGLRTPCEERGGWVGAEVAPNAGTVARPIQGFATRRPLHCPPQIQADPDIYPQEAGLLQMILRHPWAPQLSLPSPKGLRSASREAPRPRALGVVDS